jgi:hypothetical protein
LMFCDAASGIDFVVGMLACGARVGYVLIY